MGTAPRNPRGSHSKRRPADDSPKIACDSLTCPLHRVPTPTPQPVQLGPLPIPVHGPPAIARPAYTNPPYPALQTLLRTK